MKKLCVVIGFLLVSSLMANAQYNELSAQLGSGLFSFHGSKVVQESFFNIVRDAVPPPPVGSYSYTNDPWSSRSGFSWGVTMQAQHVARKNFISGLQLSYESMATRTKIVSGSDQGNFIPFQKGNATFTYEYINVHPFLGQRFGNRNLSVDVTVGLDAAIGLYNWENGRATTAANELYLTYRKRSIPGLDLRPRLNATAYYHKVGLSFSYAHGLTNYSAGLVGVSSAETTSQIWRVNAVYRIVK